MRLTRSEVYQKRASSSLHEVVKIVYNLLMGEDDATIERERELPLTATLRGGWPSAAERCTVEMWDHDSPRMSGVSMHLEGLELGVVIRGGMRMHLGTHSSLFKPGGIWLVGMWEPHRWQAAEPGTRTLCILFTPEFIGEDVLPNRHWQPMFTCPPPDRPDVPEPVRSVVLRIALEIASEGERKPPQWLTVVRLSLAKLFVLMGRCWEPPDATRAGRIHALATFDRIMPALTAVRARPTRKLSLAEAAAVCGLSKAQFSRVFSETMGMSYGRFRVRARLSYAASLLIDTELSIAAVAQRGGFTDASHLHRLFLKHYEATPGEFRLQYR
jgi:AraC-like DNA-binding protein